MCMFPACCFHKRTYIAQGLVMGYSMRLELTHVCILNYFQLVMYLNRGHSLFFLECVYFSLLYPSLIFDIFL